MNRRPSGYEPDELPGCSIPRQWGAFYGFLNWRQALMLDLPSFFRKAFCGQQKRPLCEQWPFSCIWLREPDLNRRPSGYEPDELPGCSIPRQGCVFYVLAAWCQQKNAACGKKRWGEVILRPFATAGSSRCRSCRSGPAGFPASRCALPRTRGCLRAFHGSRSRQRFRSGRWQP